MRLQSLNFQQNKDLNIKLANVLGKLILVTVQIMELI